MNLLTNGFESNCGRLFGPAEQFEADIVELWLKGFCLNGRESRYPCRRFRADSRKPKVISVGDIRRCTHPDRTTNHEFRVDCRLAATPNDLGNRE
jgi:hypothetical protein